MGAGRIVHVVAILERIDAPEDWQRARMANAGVVRGTEDWQNVLLRMRIGIRHA
jgi:hypothetical protein